MKPLLLYCLDLKDDWIDILLVIALIDQYIKYNHWDVVLLFYHKYIVDTKKTKFCDANTQHFSGFKEWKAFIPNSKKAFFEELSFSDCNSQPVR